MSEINIDHMKFISEVAFDTGIIYLQEIEWSSIIISWAAIETSVKIYDWDVFQQCDLMRIMLNNLRRRLLEIEVLTSWADVGENSTIVEIRQMLAENDTATLIEKEKLYGSSWKRRGGVGAFMMMARKWDRIENQVRRYDYDLIRAVREDISPEGIRDDVRDLRRYLILIESEMRAREAQR